MSNVIINDSNLTNIANAIRTKNKSSATYTPAEMSTAIKNIKTTEDIDGIIESYKSASETISANDFVEFVETYKEPVKISTTAGQGWHKAVCALTDDTVFIVHSSTSSASGYLNGMICKIKEDGTIEQVGSDTQLTTITYSSRWCNVAKMDDDKVFVTFMGGTTYGYVYGVVCTINDTTITPGTAVQLVSNTYSGYQSSLQTIVLDSSRVVVFNNLNSNYYLYAMVCTVNGTTITAGTNTVITTTGGAGYYADAILLDTNKILVTFGNGTMYGVVCTISDSTITPGTVTNLSSAGYTYETALVKIDNSSALLAYMDYRNNPYIKKLKINGTTITNTTGRTINNYYLTDTVAPTNKAYNLCATRLRDKIYIFHTFTGTGTPAYDLGVAIVSDIDKDFPKTAVIQLSSTGNIQYDAGVSRMGTNNRCCATGNGNIFLAHCDGSYYLYGTVINANKVKKATDHIDGVALDSITTSTAGRVKTLRR